MVFSDVFCAIVCGRLCFRDCAVWQLDRFAESGKENSPIDRAKKNPSNHGNQRLGKHGVVAC